MANDPKDALEVDSELAEESTPQEETGAQTIPDDSDDDDDDDDE